jgi:hypothetical protein
MLSRYSNLSAAGISLGLNQIEPPVMREKIIPEICKNYSADQQRSIVEMPTVAGLLFCAKGG